MTDRLSHPAISYSPTPEEDIDATLVFALLDLEDVERRASRLSASQEDTVSAIRAKADQILKRL